MKTNKRALLVFVLHFAVCVLLSFDWGIAFGTYLGFFITLLIVWALSFPLITGAVALMGGVRKSAPLSRKIIALAGGIIVLIYLFSFLGIVSFIEFVTLFIALNTLFVWGAWIYFALKNKKM